MGWLPVPLAWTVSRGWVVTIGEIFSNIGRLERADGERTVRVLVVDDDVLVRHITAVALRALGCSTAEAGNGQEALEVLQREPPDGMILDLRMPVLSGYAVLEWLETHPEYGQIGVIILSAFCAQDDDFTERPQVKAVLQKPMIMAEMDAALRRLRAEMLGYVTV